MAAWPLRRDADLSNAEALMGWDMSGAWWTPVEAALSVSLLLGGLEAAERWRTPEGVVEVRDDYLRRMHRFDVACPAADALSERTPGERRIAVAGESNGEFLGHAVEGMAARCPALHWTVVNCALSAAGPMDTARQLRRLAQADVDDVIVVMGNNPTAFYPLPTSQRDVYEALTRSRLLARFLMPKEIGAVPDGFFEPLWEAAFDALREVHSRHAVTVVEPGLNPWLLRGPSTPGAEEAAWWLQVGDAARAQAAVDSDPQAGAAWSALIASAQGDEAAALQWLASLPSTSGSKRLDFLARYREVQEELGLGATSIDAWVATGAWGAGPGFGSFADSSHLRPAAYEALVAELLPESGPCLSTAMAAPRPRSLTPVFLASAARPGWDPYVPFSQVRFHQSSLAARQRAGAPGVDAARFASDSRVDDPETRWGLWDGWHAATGERLAGFPAPTCDGGDGAACVASLRASLRAGDVDAVREGLAAARVHYADRPDVAALVRIADPLIGAAAARRQAGR